MTACSISATTMSLTRQQVDRYELPVIIKHDNRLKKRRFQRVLTTGRALRPGEHEAVETEAALLVGRRIGFGDGCFRFRDQSRKIAGT